MKIQILIGSTRPGRIAERVAKWVAASAQEQPNFEVELVDLADYDMPFFDEATSPQFNPHRQTSAVVKKFLAKVSQADGYVTVTPEYNYSIPGVLKNALDYIALELAKKPVAVVSYGAVGGARAAEHLKTMLFALKAPVVPMSLSLIGPHSLIDEDGKYIGNSASPYGPDKLLLRQLGELAWYAETLKAGREELVIANV